MTLLSRYFLEPISTLTHMLGAFASAIGLVILATLTWDDPPKMISMLLYGVCMILLYLASALLHGVKTSETNRYFLNRLDHMAIFLLIAGTYTPIAYNLFSPPWRWRVLVIVWVAVAFGALYKLFSPQIHGFLNSSIYILFGWGSAVPLIFASNIFPLIPLPGFLLLVLGGMIYSIGFLIYYFERPDPWPDIFGHHEIWHLFVLGGSLCHYLFILFYVVPFERVAGS